MSDQDLSPTKFYGGDMQAPPSVSAVRAMQEVQGQIVMAKKFPRNIFDAEKRIQEACKRPALAKSAEYAYPRGDTLVKGASIRLAEVMAQNWGNLDFGIRELSQENGESVVEAYCWDLETNVRQTKTFTVRHERKAKKAIVKLDDPRDIYELVANNGARRLRACILGIIPKDIIEAATNTCRLTLAGKSDKPLIDRVRDMVLAFDKLGVNQVMIEERLKHDIEITTLDELADLGAIFNSVRDGMTKRQDWFKFQAEPSEGAQDLNSKLNDKILTDEKTPAPPVVAEEKTVNDSTVKKTASENTFKI